MRFILSLFLLLIIVCCKPKDRNEGLECTMPLEKLKPILDDIFIYEAARSTKSLDSLSLSYSKDSVYKFIYTKYKTNRQDIQDAIECYTAKKKIVPMLREIELSYKEWRTDPKFQINECKDSVQ